MADDATLRTVEFAMRGGAIALLILLGGIAWRDAGRSLAGRLAALFAAGTAAFVLCSAGVFLGPVSLWFAPLLVLSVGNNVVFWLFASALFDDDFKLSKWHALPYAAVAAIGLADAYWLRPIGAGVAADLALRVSALIFAALGVSHALRAWRADLVERRRRLRLFIIVAAAVYISVVAGVDLIWGVRPSIELTFANALGLFSVALVIAWAMLRIGAAELFVVDAVVETARPRAAVEGDPALIAAIRREMEIERIYRQEGLTIGSLADRLKVQEHKLRQLINQAMGYRNFNAFLHHYRIAEAKSALTDPSQLEVPILTIALDAGYQSIGPFNRAFKAETGMTPSEYRRSADFENGQPDAQSAKPLAKSARV